MFAINVAFTHFKQESCALYFTASNIKKCPFIISVSKKWCSEEHQRQRKKIKIRRVHYVTTEVNYKLVFFLKKFKKQKYKIRIYRERRNKHTMFEVLQDKCI